MTTSADVLIDAFGRVREAVHDACEDLATEHLVFRVDPDANSIAWLLWHLTRIQDDHVAAAAGTEQIWTAQGWGARFRLPFDPMETGYGHSSEDVAAVEASSDLLTGYHDAVHENTIRYVQTLTDADLTEIVDPTLGVTLGVRLVSVIADDMQHAGQAAILRGIVERTQPQ